MFTLDPSVPAEIGPISWLLGVWEGTGVIDYPLGDERLTAEFGQRVSFSHDGLGYLNYSSTTWLWDEAGERIPHLSETGYWRLRRALGPADAGPGLLPGVGERTFTTADEVETLRSPEGAFELEVSIVHPDGVSELYLGPVRAGRIDLATDAVMRSSTAKEIAAGTRLYGLVDGHLLWAWDIAAFGQELRSHASARLARAE